MGPNQITERKVSSSPGERTHGGDSQSDTSLRTGVQHTLWDSRNLYTHHPAPLCTACVEPAFLPNLSLLQCQQHPPCWVGQTTSVMMHHGYLSWSGFPSVHCNLSLRGFGFIFTSSLPRELRGRLRILWAPSISQEPPLDLLLKRHKRWHFRALILIPRIWA